MDVIGISNFNVLPLILLFFLFWFFWGLSREELGLVWGRPRDYALALLYPVLVLSVIGLIAWLSGAVTVGSLNWGDVLGSFALQFVLTAVFAIVTEDGIFRGWLWASLRRAGVTVAGLVLFSAVAWAAWHIPDVLLPTDFRPTAGEAPVYILNVVAIGVTWGLMRQWSGSILVTSFSHAWWNALTYVLFGVGTTVRVLGIHNTTVFGPEVGLLGLALNVIFAGILWLAFSQAAKTMPAAAPGIEAANPAVGSYRDT